MKVIYLLFTGLVIMSATAMADPLKGTQPTESQTVQAGPPGNCFQDDKVRDLGVVKADKPMLVIKGEITETYQGKTCDPSAIWLRFKVDLPSAMTIKLTWADKENIGFASFIYQMKSGQEVKSGQKNHIEDMSRDLSANSPSEITDVARPDTTYYIRVLKWFAKEKAPAKYSISLSAVSKT
jgi:hypothetical protein